MKLGELYRFGDTVNFRGYVLFDELSISLLEVEVKSIRAAFDIVKKQNAGEQK